MADAPTPPHPVSIVEAVGELAFLALRTPTTTAEEAAGAFRNLGRYRDGAIFVGHWAGTSEWERHAVGDEIVMVLDGETTIFVTGADGETPHALTAGDLVVVPCGAWHRFETPVGVKVLTVTPQPTEHRTALPT